MKDTKYHPDYYETHEEYIEALKDANPLHLPRRQLQDLAEEYMDEARENEDWEKAHLAFRHLDLAINKAGGSGQAAQQVAMIAIQELASDEEKKQIDKRLQELQEKSQRSAQRYADRMNAREENADGEDEE